MTPPIPDGFVESGAALPGIGPLYARTSGETALGFAVTAEHCEAGRLIPALQAGFAAHAGEDFVRGLVAPDRAPGLEPDERLTSLRPREVSGWKVQPGLSAERALLFSPASNFAPTAAR